MKIELKNIKHSAFASQETHCYEAALYIDGKRWGIVGNDGYGGSDYQYKDIKKPHAASLDDISKAIEKQNRWFDYNRDTHKMDYFTYEEAQEYIKQGGDPCAPNLDTVCGDLVNQWLVQREIKRDLKTKALYLEDGKLRFLCIKGKKAADVILSAKQHKDYKDFEFLNDKPIAELMEYYQV